MLMADDHQHCDVLNVQWTYRARLSWDSADGSATGLTTLIVSCPRGFPDSTPVSGCTCCRQSVNYCRCILI